MKGKYIGPTYSNKTNNEIWIAKGDIVEIVNYYKDIERFGINVLNRTCKTNKENRDRFGFDWSIESKNIILFDGNKLEIE